MEKLLEMERAGVTLYLFGPGYLTLYARNWTINAKREDDGIKLEITASGTHLPGVIDDVYERWNKASKGLPDFSLRQIEHKSIDDEIPF